MIITITINNNTLLLTFTLFSQQLEDTDAMKLIPFALCIMLVFMLTVPKDSEGLFGVPFFLIMIAKKLGIKLVKNMNYALCKTVNDPRKLNCPNRVYGAGLTRDQAISAAKLYSKKGNAKNECENYVSECKVKKFLGK